MSGILATLIAFAGGDIGGKLLLWLLPKAVKPVARKVLPWLTSIGDDDEPPKKATRR